VIVALMVAKMGVGLVLDSIKELVDTSLPAPLVAEIRQTILAMDGVEGIHLLRTRQMGEDAYIDAHIVVDPRITVSEGHIIGDAVREELVNRFDDVVDVLVHVDPEDDLDITPYCPPTRSQVRAWLAHYLPAIAVDDFRIHYLDRHIDVELVLPFPLSQQPELLDRVQQDMQRLQGEVEAVARVSLFFRV
jgi:hypothetical protein